MNLTDLFDEAIQRKASDLHLVAGEVPCVRVDGHLVRLDLPALDLASMRDLLAPALASDSSSRLAAGLPSERTLVHNGIAFVGITFRCGSDSLAATFRILLQAIPSLERIGGDATDFLKAHSQKSHGLIVLSGPTGSGKWTTACSIVEEVNSNRDSRIFVVEAHPNYHFASKRGLVTHLHVGQDCESYLRALEISHQADLDVIAIDDIPTADVLRQMLILAETGHLVIANLYAENALDAAERLFLAAGADSDALRKALADNLIAIVGQRLFRKSNAPSRIPAYEWIANGSAVKEALLLGDIEHLAALQSSDPECKSASAAVEALVQKGEIASNPSP